MENLSAEKLNDYVPKEEQIKVDRINKIMEIEGYNYHGGRNDFAERIGMKPQNFSRCMNKKRVGEETCKKIANAFGYPLKWVLGHSDYMTTAEEFFSVLNEAGEKARLLNTGFFSFTQLLGYKAEIFPISGNIEEAIGNIHRHCIISHEGKSKAFSLEELNEFENEICDYIEMRLKRIMK